MTVWDRVRLGEVMSLDVETVEVQPDQTYPVVGVLNRGRGLLYREAVRGTETKYKTLNIIRADQVVYSRLKAFEGAITVVPRDLTEGYASQEFPTFTCGPRVLPAYFRLITTTPRLWADLQNVSTGMGGRRERVKPTDFLGLPIDLPSIAEQRRIVDVVAAVDANVEALEAEAAAAVNADRALRSSLFDTLSAPSVPASSKFDMLLGRQKSARQSVGDHVLPYLRAANISDEGLRLDDVQTMNFEPAEQVKYGLLAGDILLVEGGSIGLAARWCGQIEGVVGFDKHVIRLRARAGVSTTEYALQWAKWCRQTGAFDAQATGITIRALGFGRACAMPVPDLDVDSQEHLTAPLAASADHIAQLRREIAACQTFRSTLLTALLSQSMSIPESYDNVLDAMARLIGMPA